MKMKRVLFGAIMVGVVYSSILEPIFDSVPITEETARFVGLAMENKIEEGKKLSKKNRLKEHLKEFCEIYTQGPICLGGGSRLITKALNLEGITADFSFDQKIEVDKSGNSNVLFGKSKVMAGRHGIGSAGEFDSDGKSFKLKNLKIYESKESSIGMSLYIKKYSRSGFDCPVFFKENSTGANAEGFGIFVNEKTGTVTIMIQVKTKKGEVKKIGTSLGKIRRERWTSLVVGVSATDIKIYINGILDGFLKIHKDEKMITSTGDTYLGRHPFYTQNCDSFKFGISHFKMYNRLLKPYEVQSSAGTPFGGIEPSYFHLSCFDCTYKKAIKSCVESYHLCTTQELYGGVWQAAYIMGWTDLSYNIFVNSSLQKDDKNGLGICCRNSGI